MLNHLAQIARSRGQRLGLVAAILVGPASAQVLPVQSLGNPFGTNYQLFAEDMSADGAVIVGRTNGGWGWRWTESTGCVNLTSVNLESAAFGVSGDGTVIVGATGNSPYQTRQAVRWVGGVRSVIPFPGTDSYAVATSFDGTVIIGNARVGGYNGPRSAYRWDAVGGALALAPNTPNTFAIDISDDGSVIAGVTYPTSGPHRGFRWTQATGMQDLGDLHGGGVTVTAISGDGLVIVGFESTNTSFKPFRWSVGAGMQSLGVTLRGEALCTDETGTYIGVDGVNPLSYRWSAQETVDLRVLPGDLRSHITAMSADGRVMAGYSESNQFRNQAVRWIDNVAEVICLQAPTSSCAPTASVSGQFALGGGLPCEFRLEDGPQGSAGIFFYGIGSEQSLASPFGTVCAPGPFRRIVPVTQHLAGACGTTFSFNLNAYARSQVDPSLVIGRELIGQFWYRDASAPGGAVMSAAVRGLLGP
ncbi:MAG: hypothetical protein R3F49_03060 [Planctomycetota bacterium]